MLRPKILRISSIKKITMTITEAASIHNSVLNHLLQQDVTFGLRKRNSNKRLENGLWFLGSESRYISISFWDGYDNDRKINNISLCMELNPPYEIYLYLTARSENDNIKMIDNIASKIGASNDGLPYSWRKYYHKESDGSSEALNLAITKFVTSDKLVIDSIVVNEDDEYIRMIKTEQFLDQLSKISRYRELRNAENYQNPFQKILKRIQTEWKNEDSYMRSIEASNNEVIPYHNELQNSLKRQLHDESESINVYMEKDFVDLIAEYEDKVVLIEVKPSLSASTCIRLGLGQLLLYSARFKKFVKKDISIRIAGPENPSESDKEYISYLKNILNIDFDYIKINQDAANTASISF